MERREEEEEEDRTHEDTDIGTGGGIIGPLKRNSLLKTRLVLARRLTLRSVSRWINVSSALCSRN